MQMYIIYNSLLRITHTHTNTHIHANERTKHCRYFQNEFFWFEVVLFLYVGLLGFVVLNPKFWKFLVENTTIIAYEINKLRLQILEALHKYENSDNV